MWAPGAVQAADDEVSCGTSITVVIRFSFCFWGKNITGHKICFFPSFLPWLVDCGGVYGDDALLHCSH